MADEEKKNLKNEQGAEGSRNEKPRRKLAVVFHSQNSVNHKNHALGKTAGTKPAGAKSAGAKPAGTSAPIPAASSSGRTPAVKPKAAVHKSPNGRPLPPGTARVTPLKELNEIQRRQEAEEARQEALRREEEARRAAEEKAAAEKAAAEKAAAEKAAKEAEAKAAEIRKPQVHVVRPQSVPAADTTSAGTGRPRTAGRSDTEFNRTQTSRSMDRNAGGSRRGPAAGGIFRNDRTRNDGRSGSRPGFQRPAGTRPFGGERPSVEPAVKEKSRKDAVKPQHKTYGNKSFENEKATLSQKNRNNRKQNKYGAAVSYERVEEVQHKGPKKGGKGAFIRPEVHPVQEEEIKSITIPEVITLKDLADKMKKKPANLIKMLFMKGKMVTLNTELSYEEAENIAVEYDILCEKEKKVDVIAEITKDSEEDDPKDLVQRPPVVCVMGHVDHGKTSILDAIRNTNVTSSEHGGITQSIGAYQVRLKVNDEDRIITFLDTPGHEAFTAMRMRGAQSTDIAVLVVAADDGIMPQTVEAINHAKAANVPIVVAINKIDKPTANIDKVKQELMKYELVPEDYGGDVICCPVSAKTGEGLENLLENIVLQADVMELKANPNRKAYGVVIEAELDKGRGSVARLLVQKGTLKVGDIVEAGACYGRVRAMIDDKGRRIKKATPSMPCEILGLNAVPNAGDIFKVTDNEKDAKTYAAAFVAENKEKMVEASKKKISLDALFDQIKAGEVKELPIVVKADVQGSVEAVRDSLEKIKNDEVAVHVIHAGVGAINESDVVLASASNAIVIGFDVKPDATAKEIAEREHVDIRLYNIIYKAIEDVEDAMKGMLKPVYEEKIIGHATVRQTFKSSEVGIIAGSYVNDGVVQRDAKARIRRGEKQIFEGTIASVKRFKDDVKEVKAGFECGLVFEGFSDVQVEDTIECYVMEEVSRK